MPSQPTSALSVGWSFLWRLLLWWPVWILIFSFALSFAPDLEMDDLVFSILAGAGLIPSILLALRGARRRHARG